MGKFSRRQIDDMFLFFFFFFLKKTGFDILTSIGNNLREMLNSISWESKKNIYFKISSAETFTHSDK